MTYELVKFAPLDNGPKFWRVAGGAAVIMFAAGWMLSGKMGAGSGWAVAGLAIGSFIWFVKRNNSVYGAAKADLAKRGHNADFQIGNALIDSKARIFAFVDLAAKTYDFYSAHDILGYEHQWVDKIDASTNVWGDKIRANTSQAGNVLVFKTNNPAKPLYKVPLVNHRAGEEWMARLAAIINS